MFLLDNGEDRSRFTAKFNTTSLLKMDMKSRFDVYKKAVEDGLFSPNECRAMEDMPSYIGGDVHLIPLNMGIVNEKGEIERIVDKNVDPNANANEENSETEVRYEQDIVPTWILCHRQLSYGNCIEGGFP